MAGAGTLASDLNERTGKPAYVSFRTIAKQNMKASNEEGRYIARDVDVVTVRQIGATDSVEWEVPRWLEQNKVEVINGRLPQDHAEKYEESYRRWKLGQEMPVDGTPIKSWPVLAGIYVLSPEALRLVPSGPSNMPDLLGRVRDVNVFHLRNHWTDVGTFDSLEQARANA